MIVCGNPYTKLLKFVVETSGQLMSEEGVQSRYSLWLMHSGTMVSSAIRHHEGTRNFSRITVSWPSFRRVYSFTLNFTGFTRKVESSFLMKERIFLNDGDPL